MGSRRYWEKGAPQAWASVLSSSTACPQAALISSQSTWTEDVRPRRRPLIVPKGPSNQILNTSAGQGGRQGGRVELGAWTREGLLTRLF